MNLSPIQRLNKIRLFMLDLDGTVYLGDKPVPGAPDFINHLRKTHRDFLFLTNNSSNTAEKYITKLDSMGFAVEAGQVVTSGQATAWYIDNKKPGAAVYIVGTESLKNEFSSRHLKILDDSAKQADFVVAGFDTELTYQKLRTACRLLSDGAAFIATNPDLVCPVENNRSIPDCGSICTLLINATGKQPIYIGKPNTIFIDYLSAQRAITPGSVAMIGDRLYTDIALGCNASILTVCVLSGESDQKAISESSYKPDIIVDTVADLIPMLE